MLKPNFDAIPKFLRDLPYWSAWPAIPRENGKIGKPPVGTPWKMYKKNIPTEWMTYNETQEFFIKNQNKNFSYTDKDGKHEGKISGVGILINQSLSLVAIDLDDIFDPDGNYKEWVKPIIQELLKITYCEYSPSGKGIHAFIQGKKSIKDCRKGNIEIYDYTFLTITGHKLSACPDTIASGPDAQTIIDKLITFITDSQKNISTRGKIQKEPAQDIKDMTDSQLINKARQAKNGRTFSALFDSGDISRYPSASEADQALCNILAFWTGKDTSRMDQLMRQSKLLQDAERLAKWDKVHSQGATYGEITIAKAIQDCTIIYEPKGKTSKQEKKLDKSNADSETKKNDFIYSEDALSLIFEDKYKDTLRYDHTRKAWYGWNGTYWQLDETGKAYELIRKICRNAAKDTGPKEAFYLKKASTASAVNKFAQNAQHMAVTHKIWDSDDFLLGTPGGVVDLTTGQLMPGKCDYYITRITSVTPAEKIDAPIWFKFLNEATNGDKELQHFMQQISGMCLTGCIREHILIFIYGAGGNGKSVFLMAISNIIGEYGITAQMETFTASKTDRHPAELAALNGARLVTVSETEEGRALAEVKIKSFTGGDKISARYMRGNPFEFQPKAKLIIIGNHKPELRNVDEAMRRRINIIPFTHKPEKVDTKLPEKLKAEYPSILRWMIDGCLDWQQNGLQRPACVTEATQEYFDSQDVFGQWLEECCTQDSQFSCTSSNLFHSWKEFAEKNNLYAGNTKTFSGEMRKRGFDKPTKSHGIMKYSGITLKNNQENQGYERGCPND